MKNTIRQGRKKNRILIHISLMILVISAMLIGFKGQNEISEQNNTEISPIPPIEVSSTIEVTPTILPDQSSYTNENTTTPSIEEVDYADCFNGVEGCAVFFNADTNVYQIYNKKLSEIRSSPCSTFKIISTMMGLEKEIISSADSTMGYDGSFYSVDAWNEDLTLKDAFASSCIWYFRKLIDKLGQTDVQAYLNQLQYGNCDISGWEGSGLNPLPELNGFWLESTLEITPMEQVGILANIFDDKIGFSKENIEILKEVMLVENKDGVSIYGKTGTGRSLDTGNQDNGWFVGMIEIAEEMQYFAVHLTDESQAVSGAKAKEIALSIVNQYYCGIFKE